MTQQYLVGELSLLLGQLHTAMANEASAVEVACLRQRAETGPPSGLASVMMRALEVADCVCSDSLTRGDAAAFVRQASIGAELWEFAVGAGLLEERWVQHTYTGRGSAVALDGRGGLEPPTGGPWQSRSATRGDG